MAITHTTVPAAAAPARASAGHLDGPYEALARATEAAAAAKRTVLTARAAAVAETTQALLADIANAGLPVPQWGQGTAQLWRVWATDPRSRR